jgi:hypothetical protein
LTGLPRNMPSERVRDTFVQRFDLAEYVGPRLKPRILGTTEGASGRVQHLSLTRKVLARSWLKWSSGVFWVPALARVTGARRQLAVGLEPARRCPLGDIEASEV